ncbi:toxin glutamine deamidase domain-containing protein [Enterococcus sp. 22-H-5-01]|uniref:toxin glutamine deamidase domain-containing protein n=1 Tax=Enterococcus sp. 22-H-5-01 TaxID=3418555 RepID=UPI003D04A265
MDDVVPKLLEDIQSQFNNQMLKNKKIKQSVHALKSGEATYKEVNEFAIEVGSIAANALGENITTEILPNGKMYFNIADRIVTPTLNKNYELISGYAVDVQSLLNKQAGINLKVQSPIFDEDRVDGIVNRLSSDQDYENTNWLLNEPIINFSQSIVDNAIKENAGFHKQAGLNPKLIRKVSGHACKWCQNLAGAYDYESAPDDIYRRHERCRCIVEYVPKDGKRQNVWSKTWKDPKKDDRIKLANEKDLNQSTKAGNRDIANILNAKKGEPMTVEKADRTNANPNFYKGREYQVNCQRCVPTYELRRRGLDVEALSAADESIWSEPNSTVVRFGKKGIRGINAFVDPTTKEPISSTLVEGRTMKQNFSRLEKIVKEDERYSLSMAWKRGGAHIVNMERIDGVLSIVDAQSGSIAPIDEYFAIRKAQPKSLNYCRIDNTEINLNILEKIVMAKREG